MAGITGKAWKIEAPIPPSIEDYYFYCLVAWTIEYGLYLNCGTCIMTGIGMINFWALWEPLCRFYLLDD